MELAHATLDGWAWIVLLEHAQIIAITTVCVHPGCVSAMRGGEERPATSGRVRVIVGRTSHSLTGSASMVLVHASCLGPV